MLSSSIRFAGTTGRSPYGERGLKSREHEDNAGNANGRSPYGERGLKLEVVVGVYFRLCRSPYGERGLKFRFSGETLRLTRVALLTESVD